MTVRSSRSIPTHAEAPTRRIYVASSWRNPIQPAVVQLLREVPTFDVYDFRHPRPGATGFAWSDVDPDWLRWTPAQYIGRLNDPAAVEGYESDHEAMEWADTFVLVLPCGRSAHLELGWAAGKGKETAILLSDDGFEPELMYRMVDHLAATSSDLLRALGVGD